MLREVSFALVGVTILAYVVEWFFSFLDDPREPRRVSPTVPVVGHVIGFLRYGFDYYRITSQKTDAEIYTIGVLNFKVYVTHATRLNNIIQKTRAISSKPIIRTSNNNHSNASAKARDLFHDAVLEDFSQASKEAMAPGLGLDAQNIRMAEQSLIQVTELLEQEDIKLLEWITHASVQATAAGLYGVEHPFTDPEIEHAMWTWDEHKPGHMLGFDPLGTGYRARTTMFHAFRKYFQNVPDDVSSVIRERQRILREAGIPEEDTYKMQSNLSDAYPNFPPTLFWTIYEIFSRPPLLAAIRQELLDKAVTRSSSNNTLNLTSLQTDCHLLLSAFQETQRLRHSQVAFRIVVDDHLLDDQYLLKKGAYMHLPAKPVHQSTDIWGRDAHVFDPYRFIQTESTSKRPLPTTATTTHTKPKIVPSGFRAWGAPPHMCPARHFAATEILVFVALLALHTDLEPGNGVWEREPELRQMEIAMLPRAKRDVRLRVRKWEGMGEGKGQGAQWRVEMGRNKARVPLASG